LPAAIGETVIPAATGKISLPVRSSC